MLNKFWTSYRHLPIIGKGFSHLRWDYWCLPQLLNVKQKGLINPNLSLLASKGLYLERILLFNLLKINANTSDSVFALASRLFYTVSGFHSRWNISYCMFSDLYRKNNRNRVVKRQSMIKIKDQMNFRSCFFYLIWDTSRCSEVKRDAGPHAWKKFQLEGFSAKLKKDVDRMLERAVSLLL